MVKNKDMNKKHTFAICAYKESPYLEDCIKSIINQNLKTNVIICTSTPNKYIEKMANKYNIQYYTNDNASGIGSDWNFAYNISDSEYVTIAHQDDIYFENYTKYILESIDKYNEPIILYSEYKELRGTIFEDNNTLLKIKKIMNYPMRFKCISRWPFARRIILSIGNSICCPSVTLNKAIIGESPFSVTMKNSLDWEAWLRFTSLDGQFIYIKHALMAHRISELSETTNNISNGIRYKEDYELLKKYWPDFIAKKIIKIYSKSMKSNQL